ncbi:MAG: efflux transporter outer membrane subunit [Desulfatibacillaceae bacterium]|nr:efflux transporter outer membrane subunit [Desulfatibacillaceae bacterium]
MKKLLFILIAVLCLVLTGCRPFTPEPFSYDSLALPQEYAPGPGMEIPSTDWWLDFNDKGLALLMEKALEDNFAIAKAMARLAQARASAVVAGAALSPQIQAGAGTAFSRRLSDDGPSTERYSLNFLASYEIDLWGRLGSLKEAALLEALQAQEAVGAATVTVSAQVVENWIYLIYQKALLSLLEEQLETNQKTQELLEFRFAHALASALDVLQQRQAVEQVLAQIPLARAEEKRLANSLAFLLGQIPQDLDMEIPGSLPAPSPLPENGIPLNFIAARPDVQSARLSLESAQWRHAAAKAARLPALSITAGAGSEAARFNEVLDNWIANLGANLLAPVFDNRRRAAQVDLEAAAIEERFADFRSTLFVAIVETQNALADREGLLEQIEALERELNAATRVFEEANQRFARGVNDYLPVITALLTVQRLERSILQRQAGLLANRIALHRALGGVRLAQTGQADR